MEPYHAYLEMIIKGLVDHPDDVVITKSVDNFGVLLSVVVHPDDMGKLIGRGGKIIDQSIRPLVKANGYKHSANVSVKVIEPVGGRREPEVRPLDEVIDSL